MVVVEISDATGSRRREMEIPDDVPVKRILIVAAERMGLPQEGPDGQLVSYRFHHRNSGRQLLDEETLVQAGVRNGDELRLQPEITAGCGRPLEGRNRHAG
jgi:uncharacterized ubiquitin-like protein YukD